MAVFRFLETIVENYRLKTVQRINSIKDVVFRSGIVALVAAIIIWIAIFLYVAFYYAYMPSIMHSRPVFLQFKSCDEAQGVCSFPLAHVQLTRKQQLLMVGQAYKIFVNLEMPESPANKNLGMFMTCADMQDKRGSIVTSSCRSAMLRYKSSLLHSLKTLTFSPIMLFGSAEEKQTISIELFSDFEEDQDHPVTDVYVEIQSRHIELYSAELDIHAHFTGLRYLMFHWPVLSAAVGISSNLFFIVLIFTLSWWRVRHREGDDANIFSVKNGGEREIISKRELFTFKSESDESSFEDASFLEDTPKDGEEEELGSLVASHTREYVEELSHSASSQHIEELSEL